MMRYLTRTQRQDLAAIYSEPRHGMSGNSRRDEPSPLQMTFRRLERIDADVLHSILGGGLVRPEPREPGLYRLGLRGKDAHHLAECIGPYLDGRARSHLERALRREHEVIRRDTAA